jgi:hypothetical protein
MAMVVAIGPKSDRRLRQQATTSDRKKQFGSHETIVTRRSEGGSTRENDIVIRPYSIRMHTGIQAKDHADLALIPFRARMRLSATSRSLPTAFNAWTVAISTV